VVEGIFYSTLVIEWPKVKQLLDGGHLAPLGLIKTDSLSFKDLSPIPFVFAQATVQ
jgi:hypothetical protein